MAREHARVRGRLCDRGVIGDPGALRAFIGDPILDTWSDLRDYINSAYSVKGQVASYGRRYGACLRYRVGGRTLCALFPEIGSFTLLLVLGRHEHEKAKDEYRWLCRIVADAIEATDQLSDGPWDWLRCPGIASVADIRRLLAIKRTPARVP